MTEPTVRGLRSRLAAWVKGPRRQWLLLAADTLFVAFSLYAAYLLRFEGRIPPHYALQLKRFLPMLLLVRIPLHWVFGIHRWSFRLSGLSEGVRLVVAGVTGSACFVLVPYLLQIVGPPRSVVVIEFFLTTSLVGALRFSLRLTEPWLLEQRRARAGVGVRRAIIVGAGSTGELLLRDLRRTGGHDCDVVGFVDDDPRKRGMSIGGRPVLGSLDQLPSLARARNIERLLFAIPRLPARRVREVLDRCSDLKLEYKILPVSFGFLNAHAASAMLADLSPDDLLAREQAAFDTAALQALIGGRRILVTGAAGSIGSEICRQAAEFGASELVLADINENDLYFLFLELKKKYPTLSVLAEVVDIRDRDRMLALGRAYRPQDVFHAAAHKHVPLMEQAPEEAVKNNVVGCRNVVDMAEDVRASHFVLVSTDKAVRPSSVMGATKKIAEMLVQERASRSHTTFSAVRFGNVLGSAGSVVPLFKSQIAQGGPVTVTHPDCSRYLMTIREAVGLVLFSGLGSYGPLCILEMGEPIRVLDLARLMITLCGLVPEQDIPIVFTGLRPGEKLNEELMTPEETSRSRQLAHGIRVILSAPPDADLVQRVDRLETAARRGDRAAVRAILQSIVPQYQHETLRPAGTSA